MMQTAAQAAEQAANADRLANAALEAAEKALQEARTNNVKVEPLGNRMLISIPSADGTRRQIELSADGRQILSVDGLSTDAIMPPPFDPGFNPGRDELPKSLLVVILASLMAGVIILSPLMRALARRLDRRGGTALPDDAAKRLAAIEQAVEAVAVEVERISEGQRFTAKLLAEREPTGAIR